MTIHPLLLQLKSELRVVYLDDGAIGGAEDDVLADFMTIKDEAALLDLELNASKSELICLDPDGGSLLQIAPDLRKTHPRDAMLLDSPIGGSTSIDSTLTCKLDVLKIMGSRLCHLSRHDDLLLRNSFAIPKILYVLRTAPCFSSPLLEAYDKELRSILSDMLNISFESADVWSQATLPVGFGGIGVRSASQLAIPAFLGFSRWICGPH